MIVEYEQIRPELAAMKKPIEELGLALNVEAARGEVKELEQKTLAPDFYNDIKNSQKVLQKIKENNQKIERYEALCSDWEDLSTLVELAIAEDDESADVQIVVDAAEGQIAL